TNVPSGPGASTAAPSRRSGGAACTAPAIRASTGGSVGEAAACNAAATTREMANVEIMAADLAQGEHRVRLESTAVRPDWRTTRARHGSAPPASPVVLGVALSAVIGVALLVGLTRPDAHPDPRPPRPDAHTASHAAPLADGSRAASPGQPAAFVAPRAPDAVAIAATAATLPQLRSLLVSWQGRLVVEHYAANVRATTSANVKSASKSVLSALVGLALARGDLPPLDTPIARWFPSLRRADDTRKRAITVEHL